ncbi:MAG: TVP38/TMEM64 family protein [Alphaproteobacteria bacterium]
MVIVTAMAIVFAQGWHQLLSPRSVAESRESLQGYVQAHMAEALGLYMLTYAVVVALSLPVAAILTILGGFLFGPLLGGGAVVFAATAGAIAVFLAAKTALGDLLAERSGRVIKRMRQGFQENALSYMFFLRLVPAFPLWLVNIAPALLGVRLRTYVIGTFFGIIPGTFAYAYVGGGLDSILVKARSDPEFQACVARERVGEIPEGSCSLDLDFGDFITPELILAFVLLGVVALIPAVWRAVRRKRTTPE